MDRLNILDVVAKYFKFADPDVEYIFHSCQPSERALQLTYQAVVLLLQVLAPDSLPKAIGCDKIRFSQGHGRPYSAELKNIIDDQGSDEAVDLCFGDTRQEEAATQVVRKLSDAFTLGDGKMNVPQLMNLLVASNYAYHRYILHMNYSETIDHFAEDSFMRAAIGRLACHESLTELFATFRVETVGST